MAPCTRAARRCWSPWRPPSRCLCPGGTLCARHTASRSVSNSELKRPRACSRGTSSHSLPPGSLARWQAACPPSFCLIRRVRPAAGRPAASCCACATCRLVACLTGAPVHGVSPRARRRRRVGEVILKISDAIGAFYNGPCAKLISALGPRPALTGACCTVGAGPPPSPPSPPSQPPPPPPPPPPVSSPCDHGSDGARSDSPSSTAARARRASQVRYAASMTHARSHARTTSQPWLGIGLG